MLDPGTRWVENHANLSENIGEKNESYDACNYGTRVRKTAQNYANYRSYNSMGAVFGSETLKEDESGVSSPPLWKTSPPTSPQHRANHYRSLSPSSRAQAIAKGQRELMEMVSKMPETYYELSLKDIVERPIVEAKQERFEEENSLINNEKMYMKKKKSDIKKLQIKRSESLDNSGGFLLKMVFPVSFGSKTKKKKKKNIDSVTNNSCSKVSPKPPLSDGSGKGVDKEWWKKRFTASSESENGGLSSHNSGSTKSSGSSSRSSSTRSNSRHGSGGCWSFITTKKSKSEE